MVKVKTVSKVFLQKIPSVVNFILPNSSFRFDENFDKKEINIDKCRVINELLSLH